MDPVEKFERLIDEARAAASEDLEQIDRPIAEEPRSGALAATPCQMMLGGGPGSPSEHPCGATPTVGDNGDLVATPVDLASEFANYRDRPDDIPRPVMLSTTGTVAYTLAEVAEARCAGKVIRCENVWSETPTGKSERTAAGPPPVGPPGSIHDPARRANLLVHGAKALDMYGERPADIVAWLDERIRSRRYGDTWTRYSCRKCEATLSLGIRTDDELVVAVRLHEGACSAAAQAQISGRRADRMFVDDLHGPEIDIVAWLDERVLVHGGYPPTRYSCRKCDATLVRYLKTDDELVALTKVHESNCAAISQPEAPLGKAPQCGHQAITHGCSTCAILMAEAGALGPVDADDLRKQFGLPEPPVIHIANHYDPKMVADAFASEAGRKTVLEVIRFGNPVRRREEEIAAERATGYTDRSYAERAALVQYDEVNDAPPPRPDGFLQSQVDAAKAVLLAPVVPKGKKP